MKTNVFFKRSEHVQLYFLHERVNEFKFQVNSPKIVDDTIAILHLNMGILFALYITTENV